MNIIKSTTVYCIQMGAMFALVLLATGVTSLFCARPAYAATPPPAPSCHSLTVKQSDDKTHYELTATTTATNSDIAGYRFDFGDKQSYTFNFDSTSQKNRATATVKHTYAKNGSYNVTASVVGSKNTQPPSDASASCTVRITISQSSIEVLPATGPDDFLSLVTPLAAGIITYVIALARKTPSEMRL